MSLTHWSTLSSNYTNKLLRIISQDLLNDQSGSYWDCLNKRRNLRFEKWKTFFFFSFIKLPISSKDLTKDPAWYLPGVMWNLFRQLFTRTWVMMSQEVTTQEVYPVWHWPTFLKTDSEEWVSFKMPARQSNLTWFLQPRGPGRDRLHNQKQK